MRSNTQSTHTEPIIDRIERVNETSDKMATEYDGYAVAAAAAAPPRRGRRDCVSTGAPGGGLKICFFFGEFSDIRFSDVFRPFLCVFVTCILMECFFVILVWTSVANSGK